MKAWFVVGFEDISVISTFSTFRLYANKFCVLCGFREKLEKYLKSKAFSAKNENLDFLLQNHISSDAFCRQTKHFQKKCY